MINRVKSSCNYKSRIGFDELLGSARANRRIRCRFHRPREKNLSEEEYTDYAKRALRLCSIHQKTCILQHFGKAAIRLHIPRFQCSLPYLETHSSLLYYMTTLGVSVHTVEEAVKAEQLGATYLMASHVFPTACKPSDPPIGVDTVEAICKAVKIPVYALGGVTPKTISQLQDVPSKASPSCRAS